MSCKQELQSCKPQLKETTQHTASGFRFNILIHESNSGLALQQEDLNVHATTVISYIGFDHALHVY